MSSLITRNSIIPINVIPLTHLPDKIVYYRLKNSMIVLFGELDYAQKIKRGEAALHFLGVISPFFIKASIIGVMH